MSDTSAEMLETRADAGEGESAIVRMWLDAISVARKAEENWRKRASEAISRYRDEEDRSGKRQFNILYANTQILIPAVYNSTPVPDVRRRFGDADPAGKVAAQIIERALSYTSDAYDLDGCMRGVVFDTVMVGRGVARVRYEPTIEGEEGNERVTAQEVRCEHIDWRDLIIGPGRQWSEVPWVAFEHRLTREQLIEKFGDVGATMPLDVVVDAAKGRAKDADTRDLPDIFKRGTVYEVWDKQAREVLFVAPTVPKAPLSRVSDPLGLSDFFPIPRPVYDVVDSGSLVPLVPFDRYRDQAEELDRVTKRIGALIGVMRYRGVRDASIEEFARLADADDGEFVPSNNTMQWAQAGGLERAIWTVPIETIAAVVAQLVNHREGIKQTIYEITGLSDILRGASQASETATAQQIKAQFGSVRIRDRQAEVQRIARDLYRMMAEIIAEKFELPVLAVMTGTMLPTMAEKMAAPQQDLAAADMPTWEDVTQILRSDLLRGYRVDIETDSTIQQDVARAKTNAAEFVQGFGGFITAVGPAVQAGVMPMDVVSDLLTAFARQFRLGRQAEDALERLGRMARQPQQQPGQAEAAQAAQRAQAMDEQRLALEAEKVRGDLAIKAGHLQLEIQKFMGPMPQPPADPMAQGMMPQ